MGLIIPKCNADPETLKYTLQIYYDAGDWVSNAELIDRLSRILIANGIEEEKKEPQSYTKKTQVLSYYGLLEWENPLSNQSRRRITDYGKRLCISFQEEDKVARLNLLVEILEKNTFGRNVLGCDSDSDLEAPNIFVKSSLLLGHLTNKEFAYILGRMENDKADFSDTLFEVLIKRKQGIPVEPDSRSAKWADPKPLLALADWGFFTVKKDGVSKQYVLNKDLIELWGVRLSQLKIKNTEEKHIDADIFVDDYNDDSDSFLQETTHSPALRTKPFMLLAGISGTGKSRIVKEMAFQTCPEEGDLRSDEVTPGNYCLVEVKPNWHDSTELLGYKSVLTEHYVATKFVRFLAKAMCYPKVPFFVCLDEMNLAPVEQYFAEFLSVLESRKKGDDGEITSEPLIEASVFCDDEEHLYEALFGPSTTIEEGVQMTFVGKESQVYETLKRDGLRIPSNLIVVGTVNMDETTHQFSRKVIDRAMTVEMNIEDGDAPFKEFFASDGDLKYPTTPISEQNFLSKNVTAKQALEELSAEDQALVYKDVPSILAGINAALDGTPFKVAYRVQNELVIYFAELCRFNADANAEDLLAQAVDDILMMKVLPRVEGDNDLLEEPLKKLSELTKNTYFKAHQKVEEMKVRLDKNHFTSFWP